MAKKSKMCYGQIAPIYDIKQKSNINWKAVREGEKPTDIKRMRLKCPKCGRKPLSSIEVDDDGTEIFHKLPTPHKRKKWWKKKGRK